MSGANTHSGLAYGGVNDMRRGGFPSSQQQHPSHPSLVHAETTSLSQHSPYQQHQHQQQQQQQTYPPHQQTTRTQYPQHFLSASPSQQVNNVVTSQVASRPPAQPQPTTTMAGSRQQQRVASSRQMPSQSVTYFNQALNQPMNPAPLSSQQLTQQSMAQSVMNHQQPLNQQALSQQALSQQALREQQMNQSGQQSLGQQAMNHQQQQQQHPYQQSLSVNQLANHQPPQHATQQPLGSQPLVSQSLSQQSLSQQSLGQHPLNQQSMTLQPPNQQPLSHSSQQSDSPMLPRQSTTPRPQTQSTYTQSNLPPTASPASQPQQPQQAQHAQQVQQQQLQLPTPVPAQQQQHLPSSQPESSDMGQVEQQIQHQLQQAEDDVEMASGEEAMEGDSRLVEQPPFVRREPMGPMMSAPPQGGSFPTLEAVHQHVLTYCTSVGYAIVIGRSKKTVPGLKKVLFVCDRAGKPPKRISPEQRKRKTSSRKCDCQFGFFAIEQRTQWTVRYRPDPKHLVHNHPPSESPLNHPAARKLDTKMIAAVKELQDKGVSVQQTLEVLREQNPHTPLLSRDVYNARAAISRNPEKVAVGIAEDRPAIYSKPHPSPEERIRADLRTELAKAREDLEQRDKKIAELEARLKEMSKQIEKYEIFVDICNQRVMFNRGKLAAELDLDPGLVAGGDANAASNA